MSKTPSSHSEAAPAREEVSRKAPSPRSLEGLGAGSPASIKLLVFDVDGVLTDGSIIVDDLGRESKKFHVRDGFAIKAAMSLGLKIGVITGRSSRSVSLRITDLGIDFYLPGTVDKLVGLETVCQQAGTLPEESAFVGDDLIDIPPMMRCGYPIAVADAVDEVRSVARHVTKAAGGRGAAREAIEHILKAQNRWEELLERYGI